MNKKYLLVIMLGLPFILNAQLNGYLKGGVNFGTINKEWWWFQDYGDSIKYDKPLIRTVFGLGCQYSLSENWIFRQEVMFQIKGQGTVVPEVRSVFNSESQSIIRFMSFPFSVHRKLFSDFYLGVGIQPSHYLSGNDNYYAKEPWHGWIWSGILNAHYTFKKSIELGFEYDYDFVDYYCAGCDEKFYTYRVYVNYHFLQKE